VAVGIGFDDGHHRDTGLLSDGIEIGGNGIQINFYISTVKIQNGINSNFGLPDILSHFYKLVNHPLAIPELYVIIVKDF
jgi:hypothetical protein